MLESPRQHDVTVEPVLARRDLRERHAHLEGDACLLRQHAHRPDRAHDGDNLIEQRAELRPFAAEMIGEIMQRLAGVRLIAGGDLPPAFVAAPEGLRLSHMSRRQMSSISARWPAAPASRSSHVSNVASSASASAMYAASYAVQLFRRAQMRGRSASC